MYDIRIQTTVNFLAKLTFILFHLSNDDCNSVLLILVFFNPNYMKLQVIECILYIIKIYLTGSLWLAGEYGSCAIVFLPVPPRRQNTH